MKGFNVRQGRVDMNSTVGEITKDIVRLNLDMDREKRKAFKIKATQDNTTMTDLLNKWVDDYLNGVMKE